MIVGSIVALVTPMHADNSVDWAALERLVDFHVENGTAAIVAMGTTGESPTLPVGEHIEVIRQVVNRAKGHMPVIAGTGSNATAEAIELTALAKGVGADACLIVTPYYNRPTQEGLYQHHKSIADAVEIPQMLYNVPGRTVCDMLPDTVDRLANHTNIVAIKEATGDLERAKEVIERCADRVAVYSGDDGTAMRLMLMGGKGNVSVTANVAPDQLARMCEAAIAGDETTAKEIDDRLAPLNKALFSEANPIPVKWALAEMGLIEKGIRLPLTWMSEAHEGAMRQAMQQAGILQAL